MPNGIEAQAVKHLKKCPFVLDLLLSAVDENRTMTIALCQDGRRDRDGTPLKEFQDNARVADIACLQTLVGPDVRIRGRHAARGHLLLPRRFYRV